MFRRFIYFIEGNQITEISSRKVLRKIKPKKATPFDRKTALEKKLTEKMIALKLTHTHTPTLEYLSKMYYFYFHLGTIYLHKTQ